MFPEAPGIEVRSGGGRRGEAEDGEAAGDEEVGDLVEGEVAAGAVPVPDAVVQAQDGAGEQAWVGFGDRALFHRAGEEGGPGELEVARARAGDLAGLFLAWAGAVHGQQRLLGDQ